MTMQSPPPPSWLSPQQSFLALLALAIATALIHAIQPPSNPTANSDYDFPEVVPLQGWSPDPQRVGAAIGIDDADNAGAGAILPTGTEVASARYVYLPNTSLLNEQHHSPGELTIDMRYFTNSNGDAKSYIHQLSGDVQSSLQYQADVGSYGLYTDGDRAYATACINPAGGSTVLSDDYRSNRYRHDFRPSRIWNWALGRSAIQDRRCLWAHLSIEHDHFTSPNTATEIVEAAWLDWFQWWNTHYPSL